MDNKRMGFRRSNYFERSLIDDNMSGTADMIIDYSSHIAILLYETILFMNLYGKKGEEAYEKKYFGFSFRVINL